MLVYSKPEEHGIGTASNKKDESVKTHPFYYRGLDF